MVGKLLYCYLEKYSIKLDVSRSFVCIFAENREDTSTRFEKYSSMLDISRSFVRIFAITAKILSLALKNIQACLIFLARLFVSLQ